MHKIALIRGPGVDAMSPAEFLARDVGLTVVSAGDLVRQHVQMRTPAGELIDQHLQAGELVPDEAIASIVAEALTTADYGWVLPGYPRTILQAELLTQQGHEPDLVIELVLTEDEINRNPRLAERRALLRTTMAEYRREIEPVRLYYQARGAYRFTSGVGWHEDMAGWLAVIAAGN